MSCSRNTLITTIRKSETMIRNTIRKDYMSKDDVYEELLSIKNYLQENH